MRNLGGGELRLARDGTYSGLHPAYQKLLYN